MPEVKPRGRRMPVVKAPPPGEALPRHVVSHASGGRDLWSAPLSATPSVPREAALDALREVLDPELPISLVDLGLIYGVEVEGRTARIELTFTATACPCMEFIREDVRDRLLRERWLDEVEIEEVWDPPWTRERISEKGREQLRRLGVGA
jgi:metal-sulfur cluster biosynthetic enzyme